MENIVDKYMNWQKTESFLVFLKKSANWLCFINDDYNKSFLVHRFLIGAENEISEAPWEEKINVFLNFDKKNLEEIFVFIHNFHSCPNKYNKYLENRQKDSQKA